MLCLDLNVDEKTKKIKLREDALFNAFLGTHPDIIKKVIKSILPAYKVHEDFFALINGFVDFDEKGNSIYPGLIVRTGLFDFAVLYLENTYIDQEYMLYLIREYLEDIADGKPLEININQIEIDKSTFLEAIKDI